MKIFLVIILSILSNISNGQNAQATRDSKINDDWSFVIVFSPDYPYDDFSHDTALKRKFWGIFDVEYLIYKSNGELYCVLIIDHCNEDCSNTVLTKIIATQIYSQ